MLRTTAQNLPRALPFLWATALSLLLFAPTWWRLAQQWLQFEQILAHGLPTFLLYLGLVVAHPPKGPENGWGSSPVKRWPWLGFLVLLVVTGAWALFELVNIDILAFLALPASVGALVWVLLGFKALWRFIPYLIVLSLSLPFWGDLVSPLLSMASWVVGNLVAQIGMTALIEGYSITLPYGRLVIIDGCSGIRYFAISILLASTIAILNDYRWRGWLLALSIGMALGLIANWVRITGLVIIGYQTEMQSSLMDDHEFYGWVIYAAICLPALYFAPVKKRDEDTLKTCFTINKKGYAAIVVALLIGPMLVWINTGPVQPQPAFALNGLEPVQISTARRPPMPLQYPSLLQQSDYWLAESQVWLNLAQFQRSHSSEKLVPYIGPQFESTTWQRRRDIQAVTEHGPIIVYRNVLNQRQVAVHQWYLIGRFDTSDYNHAKLLQIPATLAQDNRFALVTLQSGCQTIGCEEGIARIQRATSDLHFGADQ